MRTPRILEQMLIGGLFLTGLAGITEEALAQAKNTQPTQPSQKPPIILPMGPTKAAVYKDNDLTKPPEIYNKVNGTLINPETGETIKPFFRGQRPQDNPYDNDTTTQPSYSTNNIDPRIQADPTNASDYIRRSDELIRNKAPSEEIINLLEMATKQKGLNGTNEEKAMIFQELGSRYFRKKEYNIALPYFLKTKELNPKFPDIDATIAYTLNKLTNNLQK